MRKLSLTELCHLLPRKAVAQGERPEPSSVSRIRGLLDQLTKVGLVTTPEGCRLTTSSLALAAGQGLRMRINLMPRRPYAGPRNAVDVLDEIRPAAERAALAARARELELARARRAVRQERPGEGPEAGQTGAGQNSVPGAAGQNSDPRGQNLTCGARILTRIWGLTCTIAGSRSVLPLSPIAQTPSRPSVRPLRQ